MKNTKFPKLRHYLLDHDERRWPRRVFWTLIVCLGLTAFYYAGRPAWRELKGWRSGRLAAQAAKLIVVEDWRGAAKKAKAAYILKPNQPEAIRLMARIQAYYEHPVALQFWNRLIKMEEATLEDRRDYSELAIRLGFLSHAHEQLADLLADYPDDPRYLWLGAQLWVAQGDLPQAVQFAALAREHDPANTVYQLFLASAWFDSPDAQSRSFAREAMFAIGREMGESGLQALLFLSRRGDLPPGQMREIQKLLLKQPDQTATIRLLERDIELRLRPDLREAILDHAAIAFKKLDSDSLHSFMGWLNSKGEFGRVLEILPAEVTMQRSDHFIQYLDALAGLGNWTEVRRLLQRKDTPLEGVYLEAYRARAATQMKDDIGVHAHWRAALRHADGRPADLWFLAGYAERNGEFEQARRAYRALINAHPNPYPAYEAFARLIEKQGSTSELRDLLREMVRRWPMNLALRNDHAYLNLLLGRELDESLQTADDLVRESPRSLPHRTTLALACYRQKYYAAALELYLGEELDWSRILPGNRAVLIAVLAANGKTNEATQLAQTLPAQLLRPEERQLVERYVPLIGGHSPSSGS
jgi:predicted Zn-dependent protease